MAVFHRFIIESTEREIDGLYVYRKLVVMWRKLENQIHMHMFLFSTSFSTKGLYTIPAILRNVNLSNYCRA